MTNDQQFSKTFRNPPGVHAPMANYTHQVEVGGSARWLLLSGQLGMTEDGAVPEDTVDQLDVALTNVERNLQAAGMTMDDAVKLTIYLVGECDVTRRRAVIAAHLPQPRPCVTMLFIAGLADPKFKVEVEAIAAVAEP